MIRQRRDRRETPSARTRRSAAPRAVAALAGLLALGACATSEPEAAAEAPDGVSIAETTRMRAEVLSIDVEAGQVQQYSLLTGEHQATWMVPGSPQVTCPLIWDSPEGERLVVTTAAENMSPEKQARYPAAGAMFVGELPIVETW